MFGQYFFHRVRLSMRDVFLGKHIKCKLVCHRLKMILVTFVCLAHSLKIFIKKIRSNFKSFHIHIRKYDEIDEIDILPINK